MTIIVSGSVDFSAEDAPRALADAVELMVETRSQKGCSAYVWAADPTTPGRVWVYERWDCEADFAAHLAGRFYSGMLAILGNYPMLNVDVQKHRVDLSEPVYDPEGRPRADFFSG